MKTLIIVLMLCLSVTSVCAQDNHLKSALENYQAGELNIAKSYIDSCMLDDQLIKNPNTWYLKGFILKDLYKTVPDSKEGLNYRLEAQQAFTHLMGMEASEKYWQDAYKTFKYLSTTYYNDAIADIESKSFASADSMYNYFKEALILSKDSSIDLHQQEIDFLLALGSGFNSAFKADSLPNKDYLEGAKTAFGRVIKLDSLNAKANYNLGVIYYNEAVNMINKMNYDEVDLIAISQIEDQSIELFKQSLPYMELAYQQDPNDVNTLEGLAGIYFSLREYDKSNEFKAKIETINQSSN